MSKVYMGIPGPDPVVSVIDGGVTTLLPGGPHGWGKINPKSTPLARAILDDFLRDEQRVLQVLGRFKWRTVASWDGDKPWTLTEAQIIGLLAEIDAIEPDIQKARVQAAFAAPPVADERGAGLSAIEKK